MNISTIRLNVADAFTQKNIPPETIFTEILAEKPDKNGIHKAHAQYSSRVPKSTLNLWHFKERRKNNGITAPVKKLEPSYVKVAVPDPVKKKAQKVIVLCSEDTNALIETLRGIL